MTDEELEAIRRRVEAATLGPQSYPEPENCPDHADNCCATWCEDCHEGRRARVVYAEDQAFIAHARQDVPALLAEVERLSGPVREWQHVASYYLGEYADAHSAKECRAEAVRRSLEAGKEQCPVCGVHEAAILKLKRVVEQLGAENHRLHRKIKGLT